MQHSMSGYCIAASFLPMVSLEEAYVNGDISPAGMLQALHCSENFVLGLRVPISEGCPAGSRNPGFVQICALSMWGPTGLADTMKSAQVSTFCTDSTCHRRRYSSTFSGSIPPNYAE